MKEVYSEVIQFRGSHFDYGMVQGKLLKDSFIVKNREEQWKVRKPLFSIQVDETKAIYERFAPQLWEEFLGLKEVLEWPMERVLLEFGGYRVSIPRSGCSIYARDNFFLRNYDYHPKTYEGRYMLYEPSDQGYATIGVSQKITGRCEGMNEKGLVMAYNFVNRRKPGNGFVCNMIGRIIIETCASVDEGVALLQEIPHRGSFNYVLFDQNTQEPMIVEASPRGVRVRTGSICTNHFEHFKEENRNYLVDSKRRKKVIEKNAKHKNDAENMFALFNDPEKGVFSDLYNSWAGTIHTSAYFPQDLVTWIALGGNQKRASFNFAKWLTDEETHQKKIIGLVNTDIPFVHMETANWYRTS